MQQTYCTTQEAGSFLTKGKVGICLGPKLKRALKLENAS